MKQLVLGTLILAGAVVHAQLPVPALALSWKAVEDTVWEFKLRPGVTFSNGSPFTAEVITIRSWPWTPATWRMRSAPAGASIRGGTGTPPPARRESTSRSVDLRLSAYGP